MRANQALSLIRVSHLGGFHFISLKNFYFKLLDFEYVSKSNDNLIRFLQENFLCEFYKCKGWNFSKFIVILRVFSGEILSLDNLLVANNLNR